MNKNIEIRFNQEYCVKSINKNGHTLLRAFTQSQMNLFEDNLVGDWYKYQTGEEPYSCVRINPKDFLIFSFCEGDIFLEYCEDAAGLKKAIQNLDHCYKGEIVYPIEKTQEGWTNAKCDLDNYVNDFDPVDDEIADHMLECVPPAVQFPDFFQVGEASFHLNDGQPAYTAFEKLNGQWFKLGDMVRQSKNPRLAI